jgi:hypothetical protein
MDNYFSARDILDKAIGTDAYFQIKSILFSLKAADVAEVRHGRWIAVRGESSGLNWKCSLCAKRVLQKSPYCPNCGALMKEEEHDKHPSDQV